MRRPAGAETRQRRADALLHAPDRARDRARAASRAPLRARGSATRPACGDALRTPCENQRQARARARTCGTRARASCRIVRAAEPRARAVAVARARANTSMLSRAHTNMLSRARATADLSDSLGSAPCLSAGSHSRSPTRSRALVHSRAQGFAGYRSRDPFARAHLSHLSYHARTAPVLAERTPSTPSRNVSALASDTLGRTYSRPRTRAHSRMRATLCAARRRRRQRFSREGRVPKGTHEGGPLDRRRHTPICPSPDLRATGWLLGGQVDRPLTPTASYIRIPTPWGHPGPGTPTSRA